MSIDQLDTDFDKVNRTLGLLVSKATGQSVDPGEYEKLRRDILQNPDLIDRAPPLLKNHRTLDSFWTYIQPKFAKYAERRSYVSSQFMPLLDYLEFGDRKPTPPAGSGVRETAAPSVARNKRQVFVVHGRDNEARLEVARFIETVGLRAIVLHEQASAGMTIIEKIEHYSNDADFALVLYTACDHGRGIHEPKVVPRSRARQNVVFEHGYLMAKLGRENVCALVKGTIETPNDISGVVYVALDPSGAWKAEVAKELKACGYELKPWF